MKNKYSYIALFLGLTLTFIGCSTKKNTWLSRNYQALNVNYNIYFNANESYKQGLERIRQNNVDDYSEVLNMYPISNHDNASVASGDMERAIKKTQTAIKKRSIRKRPKKNAQKARNNEKYREWLTQEEFNPAMYKAWMLLGKAQFHSTDFLAAVATFSYIIKHFDENVDAVAEAKLWMARSYAEMGWLYEAENVLNKIDPETMPYKQEGYCAAVNADLLLKEKRHKDAISHLQVAIENEKNKKQRTRFKYILAQLYQETGDNEKAYALYKEVLKSSDSFDMQFNAQIHLTESYVGGNKEEMLRILRKMTKASRNSDYLDQIYTAIGNIYLADADTTQAIDNYKKAVEKSTRGGYEKATALIILADLYYQKEEYRTAEPYYSEAVMIMNAQSADFRRVSERSETLNDLIRNLSEVELQDSVQTLSKLPEKEQLEQIKKLIEQVIAEEKAAKEAEEEARRLAESSFGAGNASSFSATSNIAMQMGGGNNAFYFYNVQLIAAGKTDFQKKWGTRRLEDNWRRQVKSTMAYDFFADNEEDEEDEEDAEEAKDSINNKMPEFYLRQLYKTPEQFDESDKQIKESLYNAGFIYGENLDNIPKAIETFDELARRFPEYDKLPEAYFFLYQTSKKQEDEPNALAYRQKLITEFPESRYAKILSQPDYEQRMIQMARTQDSMYEQAYFAYMESDYEKVFETYDYMEKNYPASKLMPKLMFLKSLSKARSTSQEDFTSSLQQILDEYPESDVASMSKELLAMMAQGRESQKGKSQGDLRALREEELSEEAQETKEKQFTYNPDEKHLFVIVIPNETSNGNKWQFDIAAYNFSKFLIKDYDLEKRNYDKEHELMTVKNFENETEALWYLNGLVNDKYFAKKLAAEQLTYFVISESNYKLMFYPFSIEEYLAFDKKADKKISVPKPSTVPTKETEKTEVTPAPQPQTSEEQKAETATVQTAAEQKAEPKPAEKATTAEPAVTAVEKSAEESKNATKEDTAKANVEQQSATQTKVPAAIATRDIPLEKKELPRYKGLYTLDPQAKYYFVLYAIKGDFNATTIKSNIDKHNAENYAIMNLQTELQETPTAKIVAVSLFPDLVSARTYFFNIVKKRDTLFAPMNGVQYRTIIISEDNLEELKRSRNISAYVEFLTVKKILK
ncbi:MAG: tetratricopeptide repeat protein [Paludibacteraceae bacterium]|nr:tetratricopeptide repeat protein [Paludibacteraceae bacterium]